MIEPAHTEAIPPVTHADEPLHVAFYIDSMAGGGAEKVFALIASELARGRDRVDLVLDRALGPNLALIDPAVRVVELNGPSWRAVRRLRAYAKANKPDAIIAALPQCNLVAALALVGEPIAFMPTLHAVTGLRHLAWPGMSKFAILGILLEPLMFARADAIGVVSAAIAVAKGLSRSQANKVRVLYNPVNLAQFRPVEARRDSDRKTIVSVGRLTAPKDFATVIRAFALLRAKIAADLIILGEGPDRRALERLARSLDVPVSMPGYAPDAAAIMREADLIIVSSKSEGFANTIVEGWACGTPVIATDCEGAPRELIAGHDETALVPVGDAAAMAEAALATLAAPRDRNALRERAAPFALHLAARRYRNLAATLVAERRASL